MSSGMPFYFGFAQFLSVQIGLRIIDNAKYFILRAKSILNCYLLYFLQIAGLSLTIINYDLPLATETLANSGLLA